jgi:ribose transport system ATP-binding protein
MGVAMIYQELNLAPHLTVEENLTLGMEQTSLGFIRHDYEPIRKALELLSHPDLPLHVPVSELSIGLQQVVEIARALLCNARVIIMDEPTSSLTAADTQALFQAIRRLKESGISVIYISHFLEEVTEIADTYTVLRDGETVGSGAIADVTIEDIIELMVGRKLTEMFPKSDHKIGEPLMRVEGLEGSPIPRGVTFELRRGEILGIAGLVGSGRSETIRSLFGLDRAVTGRGSVGGQTGIPLRGMKPCRALGLRMDFLSENRKEEGLATNLSIAANTTLSSLARFAGLGGWGLLSLGRERESVKKWIGEMNIRCQGRTSRWGACRAGTSRRWRWRASSNRGVRWSCSTSRRAAWTWGAKSRFIAW